MCVCARADEWYAYGLTIRNAPEQFACTIYSSADLSVWTKRGYIPVNKTLDGSNPGDAVRAVSRERGGGGGGGGGGII